MTPASGERQDDGSNAAKKDRQGRQMRTEQRARQELAKLRETNMKVKEAEHSSALTPAQMLSQAREAVFNNLRDGQGAKQKQTQSTSRSLPPLLAAAFAAQQAAARQADNGDAHEPNTDEQQMDVPRVTSARGKRNRRASLVSTAYTAQLPCAALLAKAIGGDWKAGRGDNGLSDSAEDITGTKPEPPDNQNSDEQQLRVASQTSQSPFANLASSSNSAILHNAAESEPGSDNMSRRTQNRMLPDASLSPMSLHGAKGRSASRLQGISQSVSRTSSAFDMADDEQPMHAASLSTADSDALASELASLMSSSHATAVGLHSTSSGGCPFTPTHRSIADRRASRLRPDILRALSPGPSGSLQFMDAHFSMSSAGGALAMGSGFPTASTLKPLSSMTSSDMPDMPLKDDGEDEDGSYLYRMGANSEPPSGNNAQAPMLAAALATAPLGMSGQLSGLMPAPPSNGTPPKFGRRGSMVMIGPSPTAAPMPDLQLSADVDGADDPWMALCGSSAGCPSVSSSTTRPKSQAALHIMTPQQRVAMYNRRAQSTLPDADRDVSDSTYLMPTTRGRQSTTQAMGACTGYDSGASNCSASGNGAMLPQINGARARRNSTTFFLAAQSNSGGLPAGLSNAFLSESGAAAAAAGLIPLPYGGRVAAGALEPSDHKEKDREKEQLIEALFGGMPLGGKGKAPVVPGSKSRRSSVVLADVPSGVASSGPSLTHCKSRRASVLMDPMDSCPLARSKSRRGSVVCLEGTEAAAHGKSRRQSVEMDFGKVLH